MTPETLAFLNHLLDSVVLQGNDPEFDEVSERMRQARAELRGLAVQVDGD